MRNALCILVILLVHHSAFTVQSGEIAQGNSTLRGRITDAQTGEPISEVKIIVIGTRRQATTDDDGRFVITDLPIGELELYITTVGYGLVKKPVLLKQGEETSLNVALHHESAPPLDEVTIRAGAFAETETNAASTHSLNKSELRTLSTVLVADPLRAAHGLPGVTGNDDFRDDFNLRGAGFRRVGFFLDGLSLSINPTHTISGDDGSGQISIFNSDTIASLAVLSGAYPSKYGDSTGGLLQLETREGNRVKPSGRVAASLLSASAIFDGPFAGKRGSWLATARTYFPFVINRLNEDEDGEQYAIAFNDFQGRVDYDLNSRNQIGVNAILSRSGFDPQEEGRFQTGDVTESRSRAEIIYLGWNYTSGAKFAAQTKLFRLNNDFTNRNLDAAILQDARVSEWGARSDVDWLAHPEHRIEAGIYLRSLQGRNFERQSRSGALETVSDFDRSANQQGYYLQDTWSSRALHFSLTGGVRIDRASLTDETVITPRAALSFAPLKNTRLRLGWGQYSDFPAFTHLFGFLGNENLRAERATHYNFSIEHLFSEQTRLLVEIYDREEKGLLFALNDFLVKDDQVIFLSRPFRNAIRGYGRGFEVSMHKRSANRLTGWLAYSYLKTRLTDAENGFSFVSSFEQRHTLSTYASYRMTDSFNLSAQWRYGSGLPMVGFLREVDGAFVPASERNGERLPAYSRLDVRINKAFYFKRSKLTLSAELLNVLARENVKQSGRFRESLLPFLPSVGAAFEF